MAKFARTSDEFYEDMKEIHPDFIISGVYKYNNSRMHVKHILCGYEWDVDANSLYKHSCPKCNNAVKKTQEEFEKEVYSLYPYLKITGKYQGVSKKVSVFDTRCSHEWEALPNNILKGHSCPYCSGRRVLKGYNDIATLASWMIPYLSNKDDAYIYGPYSHHYVSMTCPNCGHVMSKIIKGVYTQGFACEMCADTISYPNKFLRAFLKQLPIQNVLFEYSPKWSGNKKFDSYFVYDNNEYIVEMDGDFHYKEHFKHEPLKGVRERDLYKEQMADQHNIKLIRIEARISDVDYLSKNIIESELNSIFDLSNIDWIQCGQFASSNYLKYFCDLYISEKWNVSAKEIQKYLGISNNTYHKLIRQGTKIGWIRETAEEKSLIRSLNSYYKNGRRITVYDSNMVKIKDFNSSLACSKYLSYKFNEHISMKLVIEKLKEQEMVFYKNYYFQEKMMTDAE